MYDYLQFMWEADIALMGLGTQTVLCFITDSCPFHCFTITLHCLPSLFVLKIRISFQFPLLEVVVCGVSQQNSSSKNGCGNENCILDE